MKFRLISNSFRSAAAFAFIASVTVATGAVQSVVLISGLNEPRDVALAGNGDIYVIEAGTPFNTTGLTPITTDTGLAYFGNTGSISLLSGGVISRPVTGLPMLYNPGGDEIVGGHGIAVSGTGLTASIGLGGTAANRALGPAGASGLGSVYNPYPGGQTDVASFTVTSSNPFHVATTGNRAVFADAGNNSVMAIENGVLSRVGYLPNGTNGAEFVPTGVAFNSGGGIYVGGLSGFPFAPGSASIYLMDSGLITMFATGFTNIIDIATGPAGNLYVLEYATNGILTGDSTGGLWSLSEDGLSRELIMSTGLVHPTGLAAGPDGTLYVTHNGGSAGSGELLAITIPEPSAAGLALIAAAVLINRRRRRS